MNLSHPQSDYLLMIVWCITQSLHHVMQSNSRVTLILFMHGPKKWQIKLNTDKCVLLRCTRSLAPVQHTYTLNNRALISKSQHPYLGIVFDGTMSWSTHIQIMGNRAVKILNFVKRNLTNCSTTIKRQAYLALVRPVMEYASPVWDPYYISDIYKIYKLERVQRTAARWALSNYSREPSVTSLLSSLKWPTLQ